MEFVIACIILAIWNWLKDATKKDITGMRFDHDWYSYELHMAKNQREVEKVIKKKENRYYYDYPENIRRRKIWIDEQMRPYYEELERQEAKKKRIEERRQAQEDEIERYNKWLKDHQ